MRPDGLLPSIPLVGFQKTVSLLCAMSGKSCQGAIRNRFRCGGDICPIQFTFDNSGLVQLCHRTAVRDRCLVFYAVARKRRVAVRSSRCEPLLTALTALTVCNRCLSADPGPFRPCCRLTSHSDTGHAARLMGSYYRRDYPDAFPCFRAPRCRMVVIAR